MKPYDGRNLKKELKLKLKFPASAAALARNVPSEKAPPRC